MIRLNYFYEESCPLKDFQLRQLKEAKINRDKVEVRCHKLTPELEDHYKIDRWHTIIFEDVNFKTILRLEGPFCSEDVEIAIEAALHQVEDC